MGWKSERLLEWYQRVWIEGDLDAIDEYFSTETAANGIMPDMAVGPDDFRELVPMVMALIEGIDVSMLVTTEQDDWVAGLYKVSAMASHNSAPVVVMGQVLVRFEGEKMVETYNSFDFFGLFEQLGQLPPNSLALCLSGQPLA